jgi:hypothetical protein
LILLSIWVGFYQLAKQQGRILLRLDALERGATISDHDSQEHVVFEGLPSGAVFPGFELPDLSGKTRALSDFTGNSANPRSLVITVGPMITPFC